MKFNIFRILEKDDKELIHSSFLKYLLENWGEYFYKSFFNKSYLDFNKIELEKSYSKYRLDMEISSVDGTEIIIIENKFKSFPNKVQLKNYDELLKKHHKGKIINKFILCFDSETISFETNQWNVITYRQVLESIEIFLKLISPISDEERLFIKHYSIFLNEYFEEYETWIQDLSNLFKNANQKENKFWLRLVNTKIANLVELRFNELNVQISMDINPGNTSVPLININPKKWNVNNVEKLIQFQGNQVKFYIHTENKVIVQRYIDILKSKLDISRGKIKKLNKKQARSYFIYKENITDILPNSLDFNSIVDYLMEFYVKIDNIID